MTRIAVGVLSFVLVGGKFTAGHHSNFYLRLSGLDPDARGTSSTVFYSSLGLGSLVLNLTFRALINRERRRNDEVLCFPNGKMSGEKNNYYQRAIFGKGRLASSAVLLLLGASLFLAPHPISRMIICGAFGIAVPMAAIASSAKMRKFCVKKVRGMVNPLLQEMSWPLLRSRRIGPEL